MSDLPKLDPFKLYNKALAQISELTSLGIQLDTMVEELRNERDKAIEERDKAQHQLSELTKRTGGDAEVLDGVVVE